MSVDEENKIWSILKSNLYFIPGCLCAFQSKSVPYIKESSVSYLLFITKSTLAKNWWRGSLEPVDGYRIFFILGYSENSTKNGTARTKSRTEISQ